MYGVIDCYAKTQAVRVVEIGRRVSNLQTIARRTLLENYHIGDVIELCDVVPIPLAHFIKTGTQL